MQINTSKTTGSLAAAIALAAGSQAYAISLVPVPANLSSAVGTTTTRAWDVDGNGVTDFNFNFRFPNSTGTSGVVWQANMNPTGAINNAVVGYLGPFISYGTNLSFGQNVGPVPAVGASFRTAAQVTLASIYRSGGTPNGYGGFYPGTPNPGGSTSGASTGSVGFRIRSGATARYGWIYLTVTSSGIQFTQAALGEIGEAVQAVPVLDPEPTSLAAIALGAAAFLSRPRKSRAAHTNERLTSNGTRQTTVRHG